MRFETAIYALSGDIRKCVYMAIEYLEYEDRKHIGCSVGCGNACVLL